MDAASIYSLVKPPKDLKVELQGSFKQLRPQLRPYQCRAASWMVQREKGFLVRITARQLHAVVTRSARDMVARYDTVWGTSGSGSMTAVLQACRRHAVPWGPAVQSGRVKRQLATALSNQGQGHACLKPSSTALASSVCWAALLLQG